jgi:hypothetical protein
MGIVGDRNDMICANLSCSSGVNKTLAESASDGEVSKAMLPSWLQYIIAKWEY